MAATTTTSDAAASQGTSAAKREARISRQWSLANLVSMWRVERRAPSSKCSVEAGWPAEAVTSGQWASRLADQPTSKSEGPSESNH